MNGEDFWWKIDKILRARDISISEYAEFVGVSRGTVYRQRERKQLPKLEQFKKTEQFLDVVLDDVKAQQEQDQLLAFAAPYLKPLHEAKDWQLKAIREILGMPQEEDSTLRLPAGTKVV